MSEEIQKIWGGVIDEVADVIAELVEGVQRRGVKYTEEVDLGVTVVEEICPEAAEEHGEDWEELVRVNMHEALPEVFMEAARRAGLAPESYRIWLSGDTYFYDVMAVVDGRRAVLAFDVQLDVESCEATLWRVSVDLTTAGTWLEYDVERVRQKYRRAVEIGASGSTILLTVRVPRTGDNTVDWLAWNAAERLADMIIYDEMGLRPRSKHCEWNREMTEYSCTVII
jgi:hypothetical protein